MNEIDISDESLLRWHYTNVAQQEFDYTRREAEVEFRTDHVKVKKFPTQRDAFFAAIRKLLRSK